MLLLTKLRNTDSRIEKEILLKTAIFSVMDTKVFFYAYHSHYTYGVKFAINSCLRLKEPTFELFSILEKLRLRDLTGHAAYDAVNNYCNENECDLLYLICNRDLDCGVTATTLNKVFGPDFIPQFKVQLAVEVPVKDCPLPCIGQLKYNGVRVVAFIEDQQVILKTRNGKEFKYPELEKILLQSRSFCKGDYVLDGELTFGDSKNINHAKVSGIVNSAIKGTPIVEKLTYNVFDGMLVRDFQNRFCNLDYKSRYNEIDNVINFINSDFVKLAETYSFNSYEAIDNTFENLLSQGYEGMIIKTWKHFYNFKRSKDWIKLKAIKTADLICSAIADGTGKYEGGIGALICSGVVEGKQISVKVGSGLSDEDRINSNPHDYVNKVIEVKYNSIIQNVQTGEWSLFLPRFVTVREDL